MKKREQNLIRNWKNVLKEYPEIKRDYEEFVESMEIFFNSIDETRKSINEFSKEWKDMEKRDVYLENEFEEKIKRDKNTLLDKNTIENLVKNIFIEKGYIIEENVKSYSHKPHLADLPYDHNTTDKDKLQERYDELTNRISEIENDYGWRSTAFKGSHYESDSAKAKRMDFYEKKFKKLDKKIYKECKDLVDELKPLMDEANKLYDKNKVWSDYEKEYNSYSSVTNYGEYGELNAYEAFYLFCDQFKSKNAGKGNQINESGFYSWSPDNFSFEKGNSYLNYVLGNIMHNASFVMDGYTVYDINKGKLPKEDMDAMPKEEVNNILNKLSDLQLGYDYECEKTRDDYNLKTMKQMNKLRDYRYEKDSLERYCKNNDIPIETTR